jgi:hypothetical protein
MPSLEWWTEARQPDGTWAVADPVDDEGRQRRSPLHPLPPSALTWPYPWIDWLGAVLAGDPGRIRPRVRRPLAAGRGLPPGASRLVRDRVVLASEHGGGWGAGWATLAELEAYDWQQPVRACRRTVRFIHDEEPWERYYLEGPHWRYERKTETVPLAEVVGPFLVEVLPRLWDVAAAHQTVTPYDPTGVRCVFWYE